MYNTEQNTKRMNATRTINRKPNITIMKIPKVFKAKTKHRYIYRK